MVETGIVKLAAFMDEADVLAYMIFPVQHRAKLHSTNPIERLNGEIKRRTEADSLTDIWRGKSRSDRILGLW